MGFFSFLFAPPSTYDIGKIERGFSKDQVRQVFGKPKEVVQDGFDSTEQWIYTVPFRIYVSIHFDSQGKVARTYRSGEPAR